MKSIVTVGIAALLIVGGILVPASASAEDVSLAQIVELFISLGIIAPEKAEIALSVVREQGEALVTDDGECVAAQLTHTLHRGLTDQHTMGDVSKLQRFLAQDPTVYPSGQATGYFGPLTEQALQKWQKKIGFVEAWAGNAAEYGMVGKDTLEHINALLNVECEAADAETNQETEVLTGDDLRNAQIRKLQLILELYYESCREYPLITDGSSRTKLDGNENNGCKGATTLSDFIDSLPTEPNETPLEYHSDTQRYLIRTTFDQSNFLDLIKHDTDDWVSIGGTTVDCSDPAYCVGEF